MTAAEITVAPLPDATGASDGSSALTGLMPVVAVTLVAILAVSLPNLADPMIRFDDYPAYFADPSGFWAKTLHEGRWVNYIWHLREVVTPAWLNFAVYQTLWAIFAAALAVAALGRGGLGWFTVTLALMIVVSPPAVLISLWFNTLLPGLALVALYAVLACRLSQGQLRLLLPIFVVLTFMAYTTYPLLLLAVTLVRTQRRSFVDLIVLLTLFTASFIAAVLVTYTLNWQVHGVFDVPLADWREAAPAADLAGYLANLPTLWASLADFLDKASFGFFPATVFHLCLLAGSLAVLLRRAPLEAFYLAAGLVTGVCLVAAQVMKLGAIVPPRAFIFAWVFYAVIVVRSAEELSRTPAMTGRLARNAALLIVGSYLLQVFQQYTVYRGWQSETRLIGAAVADLPGPIFVKGQPMSILSARQAGVQNDLGFAFRLQQLTGQRVAFCTEESVRCEDFDLSDGTTANLPTAQVLTTRAGVFVSFAQQR